MLKLSHATLAFISGSIWLAMGTFLMQLGLRLSLNPSSLSGGSAAPLISALGGMVGSYSQAATLLIAAGLGIGILKGKHVLRKAARRGVERLRSFPNPMPLQKIYSPQYYLLIAGMISLGICMRFFGLPNDIRGMIDVAVGAALINGAVEYFRLGMQMRRARHQSRS